MISSMILTFLSLLPLITAAPSRIARRQTPSYPPLSTTTSYDFALVVNVTAEPTSSSNLSCIQDWVLTSYHTGAGSAFAVLIANTTYTDARTFYINGTFDEVYLGTSTILSDAGSGNETFPEGIVITPSNPDDAPQGVSEVDINAGSGSADVGLTDFSAEADPVVHLHGLDGEGFYACNTTLEFGWGVQLFYKSYDATTPESCADVELLPQCRAGNGTHLVTHYGHNQVDCYDFVAGIDWSLY